MNQQTLFDAIGRMDEKLIAEGLSNKQRAKPVQAPAPNRMSKESEPRLVNEIRQKRRTPSAWAFRFAAILAAVIGLAGAAVLLWVQFRGFSKNTPAAQESTQSTTENFDPHAAAAAFLREITPEELLNLGKPGGSLHRAAIQAWTVSEIDPESETAVLTVTFRLRPDLSVVERRYRMKRLCPQGDQTGDPASKEYEWRFTDSDSGRCWLTPPWVRFSWSVSHADGTPDEHGWFIREAPVGEVEIISPESEP